MCNISFTALDKPVKPEQVIINTMGTLAKELHMSSKRSMEMLHEIQMCHIF